LRVNSTPSGADLYLDKAKIGSTPFEGYVPFGDHVLSLKRENFYEYDTTLQITTGKNFSLSLKLKPILSNVFVESVPPGAKVWIDDEQKGVTPTTIQNLPLGEHRLKLQKDSYYESTSTFRLSAADGKLLSIKKDLVLNKTQGRKTKKYLSLAIGLGGLGAGLYLMQSANKNYEAYQKATSPAEAASLRKQVESSDQMAPIALGIGGLAAVIGITINVNK